MSKIKLLTIAIIILLLLNLGTIAFLFFSRPPQFGGRPPADHGGPKNVIIQRLHFDKAQVAQYEILIQQHQIQINVLDNQMNQQKKALYNTLDGGKQMGRDSLLEGIALLQKQVERTHYNHFAAIRALCQPGQIPYFNKLTEDLAGFFSPPPREGRPPRN